MKMAAAQIETFHWGASLCPGDESWQPPHVKSVRQVKRKCWTKDRLYVGAAASSQEKTKPDDPSKTSQPPHPQFTIRINKTYSEGARIPEKQTIIKSLQKGSLFPMFFLPFGADWRSASTSGLHHSRHMMICATFLLFPEKQSIREPICFGDWNQEHIEWLVLSKPSQLLKR